jgi:MFS family permease
MAELPRGLWALRQPSFRLIWIAFVFGQGGYWMSYVCVQLILVRITHGEPLSQSLLVVCGFGPQLILSPIAGVLADRQDRRRMMIGIQLGFATIAAGLAAITALGIDSAPAIYALVLGFGVSMAFYGVVGLAIAGQAVTRAEMPSAMALQQAAQQLARMVGPVLAVPVVFLGGPLAAFVTNAVAGVLSALLLLRVKLPAFDRPVHATSVLGQIRAGYVHARERPPALLLLTMVGVASLCTATYPNVLVPIVATTVLHQSANGFFVLIAAVGGGAAVGALLAGFLVLRPRASVAVIEMAALGVAVALIGLLPGYGAVLVTSALYGALFFALMATASSAIQQVVEEASRGRVMSLYIVAWGGLMPFGALLSGGLAHVWGARVSLVILGGLTAVYALVVALRLARRGAPKISAAGEGLRDRARGPAASPDESPISVA